MSQLTPWRRGRPQSGLATRRAHPLTQLWDEFDALFEHFLRRWPAPFDTGLGGLRPPDLEVTAQANEVVVRAELPGFEPNELDVELRGELLTIRAERKQEGDQGQGYGRVEGTIDLPPGVDPEKATATYRNGVLELHLPLTEQARAKSIPVRANQGQAAPAAQPQGQQEAAPSTQGQGQSEQEAAAAKA